MIVYFEKPTVISQHGLIQECLFTECKSVEFSINNGVKINFGDDKDFSFVKTFDIKKIE